MSSRNAPPLATSPVTPRVLMHGGVPQKSPEERELDALLREEARKRDYGPEVEEKTRQIVHDRLVEKLLAMQLPFLEGLDKRRSTIGIRKVGGASDDPGTRRDRPRPLDHAATRGARLIHGADSHHFGR